MKNHHVIDGRDAIRQILTIVFVLSFSLLSCTHDRWEQEVLVQEIILHPQNVKQICLDSQMEMSEMLRFAMDYNEQPYISHFEQFKGEYKLEAEFQSAPEDKTEWRDIVITDRNGRNHTEFQFEKGEDGWIIHNIVVSHADAVDESLESPVPRDSFPDTTADGPG